MTLISRVHLRRRLLQPPAEAGLRQEVLEPIGLGLSSYRERSRRGEVDVGQPQRPLTREISAGKAPKGANATRNQSCAEGDLGAVCGDRSIRRSCSHFVLIAEVGKRRVVTHDFG
jgi:hypothetical protein